MTNPFEQITDIKARRLAFLEEMCAHYNNTNRAITESGSCFYGPAPHTRGCAIGAWAPKLSGRSGGIAYILYNNPLCIPSWMYEMGFAFLEICQHLHDGSMYWTDTGPSEKGLEFKQKIIKDFVS